LFSIKSYYETKNYGQLKLAFKEYENFIDEFNKFEFFFKFEINHEKYMKSENFNLSEYE